EMKAVECWPTGERRGPPSHIGQAKPACWPSAARPGSTGPIRLFKLTRLTVRSRKSSKRAVNPFAVRPNRSIRQQTTAEICPFRMAASNLAHFVSLLLLLFITGACFGQVPDAKKTTARVSAYLNKLEAVGFTGSVLVEMNGRRVISHGYGFRNAAEKQKNTPDTIFDIGSITKQFTAAGILKLEMQGKLTTSDKITK